MWYHMKIIIIRSTNPFSGSTEFRGQDLLPRNIGDRRNCQQQNQENNFQFVIHESYAKACGKKVFAWQKVALLLT